MNAPNEVAQQVVGVKQNTKQQNNKSNKLQAALERCQIHALFAQYLFMH